MAFLFYQRPDYVNPPTTPLNAVDCMKYLERTRSSEKSIPSGLSFEEVMANKPLPPCSLNDFMDYLVYIEHSAENLQFLLWHQDYVKRWEQVLEKDRLLSPPWEQDVATVPKEKDVRLDGKRRPSWPMSKMFAEHNKWEILDDDIKISENKDGESFVTVSQATTSVPTTAQAQAHVGLKWQAFTIQPHRDECDQIMRHYLAFSSPRELNLSHKDRASCLHALQHTTHPSAFTPAVKIATATLRAQSHPNFIRWSICNGNKPRIIAVRGISASGILYGFVVAIVLTLSSQSRWWRFFAVPLWLSGFAGSIAAYKGLCVIMHTGHMRNLRPWEQLKDATSEDLESVKGTIGSEENAFPMAERQNGGDGYATSSVTRNRSLSLKAFGPRNGWEDADWNAAYKKKSLVRKIFDREVWVQDESLRVLQHRIVLAANIWALIITTILTIIFVALPKGNFF